MKSMQDIDRHPFIFFLTPLLKIISYILSNPKLALILFQVVIATLNNLLLLLILKKMKIRDSVAALFTLIYALSFSTLLFVSFPEIYLYSSCIGLLLTLCILPRSAPQHTHRNLYHIPFVRFGFRRQPD